MQEHTGSHNKETDITAILVVAFVIMVGALIAKTAGDFTKQSTSTSSRAASPKSSSLIAIHNSTTAYPTPTPVNCRNNMEPWFGQCISTNPANKFCPQGLKLFTCDNDDFDDSPNIGYVQYWTNPQEWFKCITHLSLGYCRAQKTINDFHSDDYCKTVTNNQKALCSSLSVLSANNNIDTKIQCPELNKGVFPFVGLQSCIVPKN